MEHQTNRVGGSILVLGALLASSGGLLHGPQPVDVPAFEALDTSRWHASHVAIGLAGALFFAAAIYLARHFVGKSGEAWGIAGTAALLLAGIGVVGVGALETTGFSIAHGMHEAGDAAAAHSAFRTITAVMASVATAAGLAGASAALLYGIAMHWTRPWPEWLAWSGIGVGVALLAITLLGITLPGALARIPNLVGQAWWVAVGVILFQMGREGAPVPAYDSEIASV